MNTDRGVAMQRTEPTDRTDRGTNVTIYWIIVTTSSLFANIVLMVALLRCGGAI
jgi:hypothetical protein